MYNDDYKDNELTFLNFKYLTKSPMPPQEGQLFSYDLNDTTKNNTATLVNEATRIQHFEQWFNGFTIFSYKMFLLIIQCYYFPTYSV